MVKVFQKQSVMATTMERMTGFHDAAGAINRLTPPPIFVQVLEDNRKSLTEGELRFRLWFGFIPIHWNARHEPGPTPTSFIDRMIEGPMASWEHQHIFRQVPGGVELTDRITLSHKPGIRGLVTRLMFDGLALRVLFAYRHWRTRRGLSDQSGYLQQG
jgi:ligand-binding SRPBCC domain-containing protein